MKNIKFYLSLIIVLCVISSMGLSVGAEGKGANEASPMKTTDSNSSFDILVKTLSQMTPTEASDIFYDSDFGGYYDVNSGGYIEVFEVKNGEVIGKVDMNEYIKRQASEPNLPREMTTSLNKAIDDEGSSDNALLFAYRYLEVSNRSTIQYGSRASIIQRNPGPGTDTLSLAFSYTQGHSFNVGLNIGESSAVKGGVSYTWNSSAKIHSEHKMSIPAGYQGYWRFDPRVRVSIGDVRTVAGPIIYKKRVRAIYPVKLGKFLDGELVAVKTRY